MDSKHWHRGDDVNVILHQVDMEILEEGWNEWTEENNLAPCEPTSYNVDEDGSVLRAKMLWRFEPENQEYFILMWLNLKFLDNLAELQYAIIHELVHLNYPDIEHGPVFEKIIEIYLKGGFSVLHQIRDHFQKIERKKQTRLTDYFI